MWDNIKLKLDRVGMGRVLHLGPSWHAEFYVGRVGRGQVGFGPSCPAHKQSTYKASLCVLQCN